jgi:GNAT superfamily N-acetyltransferase
MSNYRSMSIHVREARLTDADRIAELVAQLGYGATPDEIRSRLEIILNRGDQQVFVADDDGRAIGWVHGAISDGLDVAPYVRIAGLVVDAGYRRAGVGRMLMTHIEAWSMSRGHAVVRLTSTDARTAAHRFYERIGYTNIKTQYSFAKVLGGGGSAMLESYVPRVEPQAGDGDA